MKNVRKAKQIDFDFMKPYPRKKPQKKAHVIDSGCGAGGNYKVIKFECARCGWQSDWLLDENTITENKKGIPCGGVCNMSVNLGFC